MQENPTPKLDQHQTLWFRQLPALGFQEAHGYWFIDFDEDSQGFVVREITSSFFKKEYWYGSEHLINRKVKIDHDILYRKIEDIRHISLSLSPINNFSDWAGMDGTTYGFSYSNVFWGVRLSWWSHYPPEWQPIVRWFNDFLVWLLSELDKGSNQRIEKP